MDAREETDIDRTGRKRRSPATKLPLHDNKGKTIEIVGIGRDVTENKLSEKQVMLANERLRYLLSATSAVIYTTGTKDDYDATFVSENITQMTGYKPVEMDKPDFWISHIHPDDRQRILAEVLKMSDKEFRRYEYRFLHKSGRYIWIQDEARLIRDEAGESLELVGSWKDITEHKRVEGEIESQAKFPSENPYPVLRIHGDGTVQYANKASEPLLKAKDSGVGRPAPKEWHRLVKTVLASGRVAREEAEHDGHVFAFRAVPIVESGYVNFYGVDITEQKKAEESLRESENKFKTLADEAFDSIVIHDGQRIIEVNKAFCRLWGYDFKEAAGMKIDKFFAPECWQDVKKRIQSGYDKPYEVDTIRKDGTRFQVEIAGKPIIYKGKPARIATTRDITERKQAEKALRESETRFKELFEHMSSGVTVYEVKSDGKDFIIRNFNKSAEKIDNIRREEIIGKSVLKVFPGVRDFGLFEIFQRVWRTGKPEHHPASLYKDKRIVGWRENYVYKLPSGEIVAVYEDITVRKQAEEALKTSEERFRSLFEQAADAIVVIDARTGEMAEFNDKAHQMLGYTRTEYAKLRLSDIEAIESKEEIAAHIDKIVRQGSDIFETKQRKKDGTLCDVLVSSKLITVAGKPYLQAIWRDITERKRAEQTLRESEECYRVTFENTGSATVLIEDDTTIILANTEFERLSGFSKQEIEGRKKWTEFVAKEDLARMLEQHRLRRENREAAMKQYEFRFVTRTGNIRNIALLIDIIPGTKRSVASLMDITEYKQAEEALRESEMRFRRISAITSDIAYSCHTEENGRFSINWMMGAAGRITGYSSEEIKAQGCWRFLVVEEDIALFEENVIGLPPGSQGLCELRIRHKNGGVVWISSFAECFSEPQIPGRLLLYGGLADITERKQAEEALRKSEQEKELILSNVAEMISYLDSELRIVWTNKAACNMADMSPQEMIGRYCYEIWCHAERPCPGCPVQKAIETGQPQKGEISSGSKVWFMRGYPVFGEDGSILGVVETALDITERKMAEDALAKEHNLLRSLVDTLPGYIYVKDVNSRFVFGNASVAAHLGVKSPEELSGKTDIDFFPKEMAQRFLKEEHEIIRGGKAIIDREQCSKIDIAHTVTKVPWRDDKGNIIGIIGINHDITERKQAEKKLLEYQERLKSLASQLFLTAENERRHLATGVHDHLGQQLAIIKLRLQSLMETIRDLEILRALKQTCSEVDQAIEDSHSLTFELSNPVLYELGLEAAIEQWLTEEIGEKHGIKCSFISGIGTTELNQEISIVLFQAVRELLINVVKHAKASTVEVIVRKKGEVVEIAVNDNGIGFEQFDKALNVSDSKKGGFGLFSTKERIGYLGGSLNIESDSQNGTRVTISMPLKNNKAVSSKGGA